MFHKEFVLYNFQTVTTAQDCMLSLDFPKGKRVTDHYSILARKIMDLSQDLLPPKAQDKY